MVYSEDTEENNNKFLSKSDGDEIDLRIFFRFLTRNKIFIGLITFLFILLSLIAYNLKRKTWEGYFQIVLSGNSQKVNFSNLGSLNDPSILSLLTQGEIGGNLKTQIAILESPAVLLPVFDYVKKEKKEEEPNKNLIFPSWQKNNLKIELQKGTSVLKIVYQDSDKSLILPVLKRISEEYKLFSLKNKNDELNSAKIYLNNQIESYRKRSSESLKKVQNYSLEKNLEIFPDSLSLNTLQSGEANLNSQPDDNSFFLNTDIEILRIRTSNRIRTIDLQIKKIEELGRESEEIQYISATIPPLVSSNLYLELQNIDGKLAEVKSKYTNKEPEILKLSTKREFLVELLKEQTLGYLKAERMKLEALRETTIRPKNVLLKYKEYIRNAARDEKILVGLENNLRFLELEEAKLKKPWELIYQPTIRINHVKPILSIYLFSGIALGFVSGSIFAFYRETKKINK